MYICFIIYQQFQSSLLRQSFVFSRSVCFLLFAKQANQVIALWLHAVGRYVIFERSLSALLLLISAVTAFPKNMGNYYRSHDWDYNFGLSLSSSFKTSLSSSQQWPRLYIASIFLDLYTQFFFRHNDPPIPMWHFRGSESELVYKLSHRPSAKGAVDVFLFVIY